MDVIMASLRVESYSISKLIEIIAASIQQDVETVRTKNHVHYFETYFGSTEIHARTIVIEEPYTDRDFLEDYAAFYVKCLDKYRSRCWRLHFFSIAFTQQQFDDLLRGNDGGLTEEQLCSPDNYLGFVVVRPLPFAFVGRTCLRTYPPNVDRRYYPVTRNYEVHLAGFALKVRSLAFQEQDRAASACATSALWSAFHGTGMLFHHSILTPVEITRLAVKRIPGYGRSFPNCGLTTLQMASVISDIGLEPDLLDVSGGEHLLQGVAYAYLRVGIPIILVAWPCDASDPNNINPMDENDPRATHAIAVTGFSLGRDRAVPFPNCGTLFRHTRIDKLYVHDDQIGPFARVGIEGPLSGENKRVNFPVSLSTSWQNKEGVRGNIRFVPQVVIIPLYHKIRISYLAILNNVIDLDRREFGPLCGDRGVLPAPIEWDVYLTTGDLVKESIRNSDDLSRDSKLRLLQDQFPRFVWRATGTHAGQRIIDILYDATDIETGDYRLGCLVYDGPFKQALEVPPR